jgi:ATP-binding cassette subfamily B protein
MLKSGGSFETVIPSLVLLAGLILLNQFLNGFDVYMQEQQDRYFNGFFLRNVMAKCGRITPIHFEEYESLNHINKAKEGAQNVVLYIFVPIMLCTFYIPYFFSMGAYLFILEPILVIAILLIFIPSMLSQIVRTKVFTKLVDETTPISRKCDYYGQCLTRRELFKETRMLSAQRYFLQLFKSSLILINRKRWKAETKTQLWESGLSMITLLGYGGILFLLFRSVLSGNIQVGDFAAVLGSIGMLYRTMNEIVCGHFAGVSKNVGSVRNYFKFLDIPENNQPIMQLGEHKEITLNNVSFRYPDADEYTIKNINLTIKDGETVAFVGENGAGKSTLVRLIMGLYKPTAGQIQIGGINTTEIHPATLYQEASALFQKFQRYQFTVRDNIAISDVERPVDDKEILAAAAKSSVQIKEKVYPDGLDTMLSREFDGVDVSGGQWQRVAMARAFYRDCQLIFLDEPTASIDPIEEAHIYKKLNHISAGKTSIIVTHRLGATRIADRIIVLKNGGIVETGSHDALMTNCGIYAEMYNEQKKWYSQAENQEMSTSK